jgi:hypothetical protein
VSTLHRPLPKKKIIRNEAKQNREFTAAHNREEAAREMPHEIGDGHVARENERDRTRKQSECQQRAADNLDCALHPQER